MGILDGILKGYTTAVLGADPMDTANAYKNLQTELNTRYDADKQKFEADPANQGKAYQLPDPLQRWQDQVNGMITSGDPTLMKEGLNQLSQYQQRATATTTTDAPSSVKEFLFAKDQGYQGGYQDWVKEKAAAGRSNVNVSVNAGEKPMDVADLMKLRLPDGSPVPFGMTPNQAVAAGAQPIQTEQQRVAGTSGDVLETATEQLGGALEAASDTPTAGVLAEARTSPGVVGKLVDVGLNLAGRPMKEDEVKFSNYKTSVVQQTVKLMSGASATEGEMDTYRSMMPKFTDPPAVRKVKFEQAQQFAKSVLARNVQGGVQNRTVKPNATVSPNTDKVLQKATSKEPAWQTTSSGLKYRIVE